MNTLTQSALQYAKRGFSVIPIEPKGKKPLIAWEQYQTRAAPANEIKKMFGAPGANVAIVTGKISGLVVIDVDSEAAKEKLKSIVPNYDLDGVSRTKTGRGWQLFFAHPGTPIQNRAAVLPGLDVRGDGGYVVAPPSIHPNGKQYKWEVPLGDDLPKLPVELFKLITEPQEQTYRSRFNTAEALNGVEEGRRDETCFKLACKLRSADVPQEMAERLILEAARNCDPAFSEKIALEKVARTYAKYQAKDNGARELEFWPEFLTAKDILQAPKDPTRWILDECLPAGGASVLVSKPKVGKSTIAADLTISVSRGEPFLGRMTRQTPVAYVFLDGPLTDIAETFVKLGLRESDPVFIHAGTAPSDAINWILATVKDKGARLIIIDVLQKLCRFSDINDYSEVMTKMEPFLDLARAGNCHLMTLHHAKKDSKDDLDAAIGSTAIRGLCYTYLFAKRLPNSNRRILSSDQRGGKNLGEVGIGFDKVTGRLRVEGTIEDVEIEEAKPEIIKFLEAEESEITEKEIRKAIPVRGWIVGRALRALVKRGDIERTGQGKKGQPFRYGLSVALFDGQSSLSSPKEGVLGGDNTGLEKEKNEQGVANTRENSSPRRSGLAQDKQDPNGLAGLESEGWEEIL